jgi:hypothetical protein
LPDISVVVPQEVAFSMFFEPNFAHFFCIERSGIVIAFATEVELENPSPCVLLRMRLEKGTFTAVLCRLPNGSIQERTTGMGTL